jgi:hypothetical protein
VTGGLAGVEWPDVVLTLAKRGWARLAGVVAPELCQALTGAAPEWSEPQHEEEFGVSSGRGGASHSSVDDAALAVREFAAAVVAAVNNAVPDLPPVPEFNHVQWVRDDRGVMFITPHRDPPTAGGILAVLTASGAGTFRVWDDNGEHEWLTSDGDLVLLRGAGWPSPHSECPVHQTESPRQGGRTAITFRHNIGGYGSDYFAALRAKQAPTV